MPIFFSIDAQLTALRSPGCAPIDYLGLGTMNREIGPLVPWGDLRQARQHDIPTMFSAMSCLLALMNILVPVMA